METGARVRTRQVFTAAAVDEDVDPGDAFQLISVDIDFNTAPVSAEDVTITKSLLRSRLRNVALTSADTLSFKPNTKSNMESFMGCSVPIRGTA